MSSTSKTIMLRALLDSDDWEQFKIPASRHVAIWACHYFELAKEFDFDEGRFGVLTYYLLNILRATKANINYHDLTKLIRIKTKSKVRHQSPQSYAYFGRDLNYTFLGGSTTNEDPYYFVSPGDNEKECIIDAGSLHGVYPVSEGETWAALYHSDVNISEANPEDAIHVLFKEVRPHESVLELQEDDVFPADAEFLKAVIIASPVTPTKVSLMAEVEEDLVASEMLGTLQEGLSLLRDEVAKQASLEIVDKPEDSQYNLFAYQFEGQLKYRITAKDSISAVIPPHEGLNAENAKQLVEEMDQIARWERVLHLENKHPTLIQPGDIDIVVLDADGNEIPIVDGKIEMEANEKVLIDAEKNISSWFGAPFYLKVEFKNKRQVPLHCALINLSANYGIYSNLLPSGTLLGKKDFVDGRDEIHWEDWEVFAGAPRGTEFSDVLPYDPYVPDSYVQRGVLETEDHYKLIVSTEQFDPLHLYKAGFDDPTGVKDGSQLPVNSALDVLMQQVHTRHVGRRPDLARKKEKASDWYTTGFSLITRVVLPTEETEED